MQCIFKYPLCYSQINISKQIYSSRSGKNKNITEQAVTYHRVRLAEAIFLLL